MNFSEKKPGVSNILIGAGPANLAVLACLEERFPSSISSTRLFERRPNSDWHPDFRFDSSTLQVSLLKDLAFTRDPTSKFTFWNFLHQQNLLSSFIHLNTYFPSRSLFSKYLNWVQDQFNDISQFNTKVLGVQPEEGAYRVQVEEGPEQKQYEVSAQNVVIALGHEPFMPDHLKCNASTFHAIQFKSEFERFKTRENLRVAVVGSGQTAGELIQNLMGMDNVADILCISRGYLFQQTDDNPFVNDLYTFDGVDRVRNEISESRRSLMSELSNTNYAAVTSDILQDIYKARFADLLNGRQRLRLQAHSEVLEITQADNGLKLQLRDGVGNTFEENVDLLIACTGFQNTRHLDLLAPLDLPMNEDGQLIVDRNYRVEGTGDQQSGVFVMNHATDTSLAEHTLGGLAGRAQLICENLMLPGAGCEMESPTEKQLAVEAI